MLPENVHNDDLEYLAEQGFEAVPANDADLAELKKKVRAKSRSTSRIYLVTGGFVLAAVLGIFLLLDRSKDRPGALASHPVKAGEEKTAPAAAPAGSLIELDTVDVVKENFINPQVKVKKSKPAAQAAPEVHTDSVDVIVAKPIDLSLLGNKPLKEEKLKYIINSPVFYLHDMKITNYTTLYFRKNHFIKYSGLGAIYSGTAEAVSAVSELQEQPDYYLHEEIANAMLHFKYGRYDQAINSLRTVSSYNPSDVNCDFYLAMCYYYKKNFAKAIELFDQCISNTNNTFLQEAMYYKAMSLYEKNDREEAKRLLKKIAEEGEFYAAKAKAQLAPE